eukprot:TRINITY_DN879_c0_g1_i1.p1 TRINITY_DN879_c0_g1~~TRINITY_DN879_c0_g1_i1.p1  ORF type:complete len:416 (-),score=181.79 TRINITY_DN879_c0_g1_i1:73-1320(-)
MDMLRDVSDNGQQEINVDALKSEIRAAIINQKTNACPIAARFAWHSSGTFDKNDNTGGSDGATILFSPEKDDPANAGLGIIKDLLLDVKNNHPEISFADLITITGCVGIEFLGGPKIPFSFGRTDESDNSKCPANGRLPDATLGADHLREVFGRMGFNDKEIVCLSGAHTLGRCHAVRSGFDGPWTTHPLRFDNQYFKNLIERKWVERQWEGPKQYEDEETGKLMMLPTDLCLIQDDGFKPHVELYANDEKAFFDDFAIVFAKLLSLGCPAQADPFAEGSEPSDKDKASAEFRELAMHGSVHLAKKVRDKSDVHQLEATSGRSALHKAAFWGHIQMTKYLVNECKLDTNVQDYAGDTALHDAARFGHVEVVKALLDGGASTSLKNKKNQTSLDVAIDHSKNEVIALFNNNIPSRL